MRKMRRNVRSSRLRTTAREARRWLSRRRSSRRRGVVEGTERLRCPNDIGEREAVGVGHDRVVSFLSHWGLG